MSFSGFFKFLYNIQIKDESTYCFFFLIINLVSRNRIWLHPRLKYISILLTTLNQNSDTSNILWQLFLTLECAPLSEPVFE